MKIIFLDVDGTLNTCFEKEFPKEHVIKQGPYRIGRYQAEQIVRALKETGAKVVLTSTLRKSQDGIAFVFYALSQLGFSQSVHYTTPILRKDPYEANERVREIELWLEKHSSWNIEGFAVVDDEKMDAFGEAMFLCRTHRSKHFPDFHVEKTSKGQRFERRTQLGVTKELADAIISYLNSV